MGVVQLVTDASIDPRERRKALVERMVRDLVRYDAFRNEADSVRSLFGRGYRMLDIAMMVGEAQALAFQEIVAKEMSES